MPKKLTEAEQMEKWNFYFSKLSRHELALAMSQEGMQQCQSAFFRAAAKLYCQDPEFRKQMKPLIQEEIVITSLGKHSRL